MGALSTFTDFMNVTGPLIYTSASDVIAEATERSYLLRRFLKGSDAERTIQGGSTIRDVIMFDEDSTAEFYQPNDTFVWSQPQVLEDWEINWRFLMDHMSWTDQEIELNIQSGLSQEARFLAYKKLKRIKEQRMWLSKINKMERQLFRMPNVAQMETNTGEEPYSIPVFVNAETNTLFGATDAASVPGGAFTTVEGIASATETRWRNQVRLYSSVAAGTGAAPSANNIIGAFDDMFYLVRFEAPPTREEYFQNAKAFGQFIACSRFGMNTYKALMRASQDLYVTTSRQDPAYISPMYAGIDLVYVSQLDTAALYPHDTPGTARQAEILTTGLVNTACADQGPRYYWLNAEYLNMAFHTTHYMLMDEVMRHPNQPKTRIQPCDTWYNMPCRSRQRLGIVAPTGPVYT